MLTPEDLAPPFSWMLRAYLDGDYMTFAAGLLMGLVALLRVLGLTRLIDKGWLKWIAVGVSTALGLGLGAYAGLPLPKVLSVAVAIGWASIGAWETTVEPIRSRLRDRAAAKTLAAVTASIPTTPAAPTLRTLVDDIDDPEERGPRP